MTALSPLEKVHKKGLFGNHYKKDEEEIIEISEVNNLSLIHLTQYRKSKNSLKNLKIEGLEIPTENSCVTSNSQTRVLWNAPNAWLILSDKKNINNDLKKNFDITDFAITDISHSRAIIQIKGLKTQEVLKKGSPINFDEFKTNKCIGTIFNGISVVINSTSNNPNTFIILTLRSFGESLYHHITDASLEFGYIGV